MLVYDTNGRYSCKMKRPLSHKLAVSPIVSQTWSSTNPRQPYCIVKSRVDYCNAVYAMSLQTITDRLQRMMNAAARVVSDTCKYDRGLKTMKIFYSPEENW